MKVQELLEVASDIENPQGVHYLMLYVLFDLAGKNKDNGVYADLYKGRFHVQEEVWEKVYALWLLDALLERTEASAELAQSTNKAASFLLLHSSKITDWDREILSLFRDLNDSFNGLTYARHLAKSKDPKDIMEVIRVLYENEMYGQIYEYFTEWEKNGVNVFELICKFFVEEAQDATILFDYPLRKDQEQAVENYLEGKNELLVLFYIQRKKHKDSLIKYKEMILSKEIQSPWFANYMSRYVKLLGNKGELAELCKTIPIHLLKTSEPRVSLSKEAATIYNLEEVNIPVIKVEKSEKTTKRSKKIPGRPSTGTPFPHFESKMQVSKEKKTLGTFWSLGSDAKIKEATNQSMSSILSSRRRSSRPHSILPKDLTEFTEEQSEIRRQLSFPMEEPQTLGTAFPELEIGDAKIMEEIKRRCTENIMESVAEETEVKGDEVDSEKERITTQAIEARMKEPLSEKPKLVSPEGEMEGKPKRRIVTKKVSAATPVVYYFGSYLY
eukprot:TRINITY_DN1874_c0_g1_i1.p1 TRINITY_DN1874_c0_g1~~TRINITY_DN1874_c0_g1_i1.p1  ORF type:complete len:499 (+),score=67.78 TRINITY_DN1874_c0_g1_i1:8055-9551(+)